MPFGLKNAPSQFQKVIVTLFKPFLVNVLIYVDDIFLFSKDVDSHEKLLTEYIYIYIYIYIEREREREREAFFIRIG